MRYAPKVSEPELAPQPQIKRAGTFALFLLFFAVHFAIVSLLTLLVLREMSAAAEPASLSLSRDYPLAWSGVMHAWSALSTPTQWLDAFVRTAQVPLYRWNESTRILLQCGFCGLVWSTVTFVLYLLGRWIIFEARKTGSPQETPAVIPSASPVVSAPS